MHSVYTEDMNMECLRNLFLSFSRNRRSNSTKISLIPCMTLKPTSENSFFIKGIIIDDATWICGLSLIRSSFSMINVKFGEQVLESYTLSVQLNIEAAWQS